VIVETSVDALVARAQRLAAGGERRILGITGPPGAGKSTISAAVVGALGARACLVGMDGFHLAQRELERLGRADRKGAVDTFDAAGYIALLRRLRGPDPDTVYAPEFRREIEEPIACAVPVAPGVPLVITEGNYLLTWDDVRPLLDEAWYVEHDEEERIARLIDCHEHFGKPRAYAEAWVHGSDEPNAELVARTRDRADVLVRVPWSVQEVGEPAGVDAGEF
jgi:pantothenate kinase